MSQRLVVAIALMGAISLAVGLGLGRITAPEGLSDRVIAERYVDRRDHEDLERERDQLAEALEKAREESRARAERSDRRSQELARQVEALEQQILDRDRAAAEAAEAAEAARPGAPIAFGKYADLDAVRSADWIEMAGAVDAINELLVDLVRRKSEGLPLDVDFQKKVAAENNKLVQYAAALMGKIPTNSPINGEFSHPITIANLMGAMLDAAEVPLSDVQVRDIARIGSEYDEEYDRLQTTYGEGTPRLRKIIDELDLKRGCVRRMQALLDEEQRGTVIRPEIHDRLQLDTLSPATSAALIAKPTQITDREQLRSRVEHVIAKDLRVTTEATDRLRAIQDELCRDLSPLLETPVDPGVPIHLDEALTAGQAQAKAVAALLELPDLDTAARNNLLSGAGWFVPRLVETAE